jgi:hypothetical protein
MPFNRRSTVLFSSAIALSKLSVVVAAPVVTPAPVFGRPEDCAVPALLVPGGGDVSCGDVGLADEGLPIPVPCALPWATVAAGVSRIAIVANAVVTDNLRMAILSLADINESAKRRFQQALEQCNLRKLIEFDDDTFDKLKQLGRDRMATMQELADEAFADLLKKHGIPIDLKDALRKSARLQEATRLQATTKPAPAAPQGARRRGRKR